MNDAERRAFVEGAAWAKHEGARERDELTNFAPWERCNEEWQRQYRARVEREAPIDRLLAVLESGAG